jgi:hypothetical protein
MMKRIVLRLCVLVILATSACTPAANSTYASLITEIRELHSDNVHPEFVQARDRGGHLIVSGQVSNDPETPRRYTGTVLVEVRDVQEKVLRQSRACFKPQEEVYPRGQMYSRRPPILEVDLGDGFKGPMKLVVSVKTGQCNLASAAAAKGPDQCDVGRLYPDPNTPRRTEIAPSC